MMLDAADSAAAFAPPGRCWLPLPARSLFHFHLPHHFRWLDATPYSHATLMRCCRLFALYRWMLTLLIAAAAPWR
jgi:hypothetical protein